MKPINTFPFLVSPQALLLRPEARQIDTSGDEAGRNQRETLPQHTEAQAEQEQAETAAAGAPRVLTVPRVGPQGGHHRRRHHGCVPRVLGAVLLC